jgi:cold shock CspA family protein
VVEAGVIVSWFAEKRFGFIRSDNNSHLKDFFMHEADCVGGKPEKGKRVTFEIVSKRDGRVAANNVKVQTEEKGSKLWLQD